MAPPGPRLPRRPLLGARLAHAAGVVYLSLPTLAFGGTMNFLQWNPHWQCFVWNQNGCKANVEAMAGTFLKEHDVDFANFVEFSSDYKPPQPWELISQVCGQDSTGLVYNTLRWTKSNAAGACQAGCMVTNDRAFVVQAFESVAGMVGQGVPSQVVIIGGHFPHPVNFGDHLTPELAAVLEGALSSVMKETGIDQVALIADTNEYSVTTNAVIGEYLHIPGGAGRLVSTSLEPTCCADVDFPWWGTFDRVISNFGASMQTTVLIKELPSWAYQTLGAAKGAFHKPILGSLFVPNTTTSTTITTTLTTTTTTITTSSTTTSTHNTVTSPGPSGLVIAASFGGGLVLLGLAGLACYFWRRRPAAARDVERLRSGQGNELPHADHRQAH